MQIQIGPVLYEVLFLHELCNEGGALMGDFNSNKARIRVNADDDEQVQVVTLWHEIVHGILYTAGIRDHDETLIDALAFGLVQVMRDNPEIIPRYDAVESDGSSPGP
jgi:hypothetical protein